MHVLSTTCLAPVLLDFKWSLVDSISWADLKSANERYRLQFNLQENRPPKIYDIVLDPNMVRPVIEASSLTNGFDFLKFSVVNGQSLLELQTAFVSGFLVGLHKPYCYYGFTNDCNNCRFFVHSEKAISVYKSIALRTPFSAQKCA